MFKLFRKKQKTPYEQFVGDYSDLLEIITGKIMDAEDYSEIEEPMGMLDHLAELGLDHARGMYGLAYLRDDKPWYDPEKGIEALKKAAENGDPFSEHMLGSILFNGQRGIPVDKIMSKYWLDKAAEAGYEPAQDDKAMIWPGR